MLLFCLERVLFEVERGKRELCVPSVALATLTKEAVRERFTLLVDEEERLWVPGRMEGDGWDGPEMMWLEFASVGSGKPVPETEERLDCTEAFWAARRAESSRVRRLT